MPGAESFSHDGDSTGVLLCHGFTGSPQSLRPWAEYLADAGLSVSLPRLPGHGTTWQEMARTRWEDWYAEVNRAFEELRGRSDQIFVMGLSIGGCLALRLAEMRGSAISGLVLVNPSVTADTRLFALAPALKLIVPSLKGIASDIKKEGVKELGYERIPCALRSHAARTVAEHQGRAEGSYPARSGLPQHRGSCRRRRQRPPPAGCAAA
jgi:carboxylesterase